MGLTDLTSQLDFVPGNQPIGNMETTPSIDLAGAFDQGETSTLAQDSLENIYQLIGLKRIKNIFPKNYILKDREDFVWGKTGTLRNNHNYSGYIITDKGKIYVFSIMINHFTNDLAKIKEAIADFLIYLKSGRGRPN